MKDHWPDPNSHGWIDAWNGWYETEAEARGDAAPSTAVGRPWILAYGEGLITEDELERRTKALPLHEITARQLRPGVIVANLGVIDRVRRDGVFVIASVRGTVWSLATGMGDIRNLDRVWHEAETIVLDRVR